MIPEAIYATCEKWMRGRHGLIVAYEEQLREARARAESAAAPPPDLAGVHAPQPSSALERRALSVLEAEDRLRDALLWDDAVERLRRLYPPDTREGRVLEYVYIEGHSQKFVCNVMHRERKAIRRMRDTLVISCALLAAEAGLVRLEDTGSNGNV